MTTSQTPASTMSPFAGFWRLAVVCFAVLTVVLYAAHSLRETEDYLWIIRTCTLRDVVREFPIGRQALVSSLHIMPLSSLVALPFVPFLKPENYGYAHMYGLAMLLALSAPALSAMLKRAGLKRLSDAASVLLLGVTALLFGSTPMNDILACAACLVPAVYFESVPQPALRATSGVFWGCALFAHPLGIALAAIRCFLMLIRRVFRPPDRERNAISWIQSISITYTVVIYIFLNWMIMHDPIYPFRTFRHGSAGQPLGPALDGLAESLNREYSGCAPVVSGHWGYVVEPLLRRHRGYHLIDFYPDKLPAEETRNLLLILPAAGNPLYPLSDLDSRRRMSATGNLKGSLRLKGLPLWEFYLIRPAHDTKTASTVASPR